MSAEVTLILYAVLFGPCLLGVLYLATSAALGFAERRYGMKGEEFLEGE